MSNEKLNRRDFLKIFGGATAITSAAMVGCKSDKPAARGGVSQGPLPKGQMTYRTSSTTGDKVSLLGYGMMRLPLTKDATGAEIIDQDKVNELVDEAIEYGVNYFDTAPVYVRGFSETATGIALKRHPREKFMVATKLSTHRDSKEMRSRKGSIELYQKSMRDLQVDYIDYYLLHGCGVGKPVYLTEKDQDEEFDSEAMLTLKERFFDNGILDYLIEEKKAGRIKNLGWSFHGEQKVWDYMMSLQDKGKVKWDFVQIQHNYIDWNYASGWNINSEYLYGEATKRGIPVVVMEPLLGGRLAAIPDYLGARLIQKRSDKSIASWAFRYAGSFDNILTVLSGMTYQDHLRDNIRSYAPLEWLSAEEFELVYDTAKKMKEFPLVPCTACQYCMPCPYGIDIPSLFLHYNRCVCENNFPQDKLDPNYKSARRIFLVGYDRSVPKLRQASRCIGCDQCKVHCPQGINIPEELTKIDKYVETLKVNKP